MSKALKRLVDALEKNKYELIMVNCGDEVVSVPRKTLLTALKTAQFQKDYEHRLSQAGLPVTARSIDSD